MAFEQRPVELVIDRRWLRAGVYKPRPDGEPYVIVIPPPNVTAVLHVGHALNNVIQDVLIRFERMRGRAAEWLPGTDHAGIATQNVVEKQLADEGTTRMDLGREAFVERVWAFVRETGNTILEQLKVIGCSCDWSRTRFTLDPAYSRAVREVFVRLWEEGLIYRGHRVIHWCPHCLTALSDEEAEFQDETGNLYYIRYPVEGGPRPYLTVATTRPETLLGDTAVAVNPKDARHAAFIGKTARLPITDIAIPIIADDGDRDVGDRKPGGLADERSVPRVLRVHGHGGIAEQRLGTRRRHGEIGPRASLDGIADVVQVAGLVLKFGLFVRQRGETVGAPVDHPVAAVDQALLPQPHEDLAHGARVGRVQGEAGAAPVARAADHLELLEDGVARFAHER